MRLFAAGIMALGLLGTSTTARADNGCAKYSHGRDEIDRFDDEAIFSLSGCGKGRIDKADGIFWIDRPSHKVTEIARVYHVLTCYDVGADKAMDMYLPDRVLMCGMDAKLLNKAAFEAEADATALDAAHKAKLKARFAEVQGYVERANRVAAERAKDPVYKQVLDAEAAALKDWDTFYADNKATIDGAYAVEDKWFAGDERSKAVDLGCEPVRAGWQKWLAGKKLSSAKQIPDSVRSDELATIALRALALCDAAGNIQPAATVEAEAIERGFPFRGMRMHAIYAAMTALGKLIPESQEPAMKPVTVTDAIREQITDRLRKDNFSAARSDQLEQGKIEKIAPSGSDMLVSFKKESWMEPDMQCYDLPSRYWSQSDGRYKHDFACKKVGEHKETSQLDPAIFPAAYAKGLKPGQVATLRTGQNAGKRYGFAIESRSGTKVGDKGKEKFVKKGNDMLQTGGTLDVAYGMPVH